MMNNYKWIYGIVLSLLATPLLAAPIVFLDLDGDGLQDTSTSVTLGNSFTAGLYVTVDNLNGGLISWGTEMNFSSSLLSASSFSLAPAWPLPGATNNIDNTTGSVELLAATFSAQSGTLKLADITFDTLNTGLASLTLNEYLPGLVTFSGFVAADGRDYDAEINFAFANATVNITPVPIPGALFLFLSGLAGLVRFRKK